ncbi:aldo/keto reductase [candidate division KSB1 bacterium]|nr:aldo/keto reductase [candidate division KSB1 bacterium]
MQTRKLGWTDLELTTVGFGAWAIGGGDWQFGWGDQDDDISIKAIHKALDEGINWIDTAAVYGCGHSERVVGKALKQTRHRPFVATKCGRVCDEQKRISSWIKPESIRRELEASLRNLQLDTIDLYQIHWPDPDEDIEDAWHAMAEFIKEGKIRYAGVSNFNIAQLERIQAIHPVASLQPPYSMLRRDVETELLDYCAQHQIGVVVYSPMQKGLLTGKVTRERMKDLPANDYRSNDPWFKEPLLSKHLNIVDKLRPIAERNNITLAQLAIAWVLRRSGVTSAIVGTRKPEQIVETAKAGDMELSYADVNEIYTILTS